MEQYPVIGNHGPVPYPFGLQWPIAVAAQLACTLEATAPKLGNVHPAASFDDMHYGHFLLSAVAIEPVFRRAAELSIGQLVLMATRATRAATNLNTNLGTLLLLAPLARTQSLSPTVHLDSLRSSLGQQLKSLSPQDTSDVYEAIRLANPGGMGKAPQHDIHEAAPRSLLQAMQLASKVDAVARQYVTDYEDIFVRIVPALDEVLGLHVNPFEAICQLQLRCLAAEPDGLIVRKAGERIATEVQAMAHEIVASEQPDDQSMKRQTLDRFLRADGHRRNPGTTADLIACALFVRLVCP